MSRLDLDNFNPEQIAKAEAELWRSYYNHQFAKMLVQIYRVMRSQLDPGIWLALQLMWYSGVATARFRLKRGQENYDQVLRGLTKYYALISSHSPRQFDYKKAAEAELIWWDKHRYPSKYESSLAETLSAPMAIVYGVSPKLLHDYGKYRARAAEMVSHESDKYHTKNDWAAIEKLLIKSWSSLHAAVVDKSKTR